MLEPSPARVAAVLWDMDGTLVDTEPYWMRAEGELVTSWGGTWTHADAIGLVGNGLHASAAVLQSHGVGLSAEEIITILTDRVMDQIAEHVPWRPGARELLAEVRAAGIPTALVTMSVRRMADRIEAALEHELGGPAFDAIVAGDEVEQPKPFPEPYLRAAELLGVDAADCVAIEDSEPGVASAVAAGTTTVAVPFHVPLPADEAYTLLPNGLDGVGLAALAAAHATRLADGAVR
ncbi:HAD family hydrolase [Protaetiibacter larvae]|uniref:HAD family hydrolase n=1 Tax=Protaetiibacter larvae TaxID=2592654 RepID=A0A5C1YA80_9MICO|nr:HAD family hydrolase [Protaetiibacter larvae]